MLGLVVKTSALNVLFELFKEGESDNMGCCSQEKEELRTDIHEILEDESALSCLDEEEWKLLIKKIDDAIDECECE